MEVHVSQETVAEGDYCREARQTAISSDQIQETTIIGEPGLPSNGVVKNYKSYNKEMEESITKNIMQSLNQMIKTLKKLIKEVQENIQKAENKPQQTQVYVSEVTRQDTSKIQRSGNNKKKAP